MVFCREFPHSIGTMQWGCLVWTGDGISCPGFPSIVDTSLGHVPVFHAPPSREKNTRGPAPSPLQIPSGCPSTERSNHGVFTSKIDIPNPRCGTSIHEEIHISSRLQTNRFLSFLRMCPWHNKEINPYNISGKGRNVLSHPIWISISQKPVYVEDKKRINTIWDHTIRVFKNRRRKLSFKMGSPTISSCQFKDPFVKSLNITMVNLRYGIVFVG